MAPPRKDPDASKAPGEEVTMAASVVPAAAQRSLWRNGDPTGSEGRLLTFVGGDRDA